MPNTYFKFKKFTINHDKCAMKVGTDGVLLGAWANTNNASQILDIGTGTGLIAIMLAQRNNTATIDAVEIDTDACIQAAENIENCAWENNIKLHASSFQLFVTTITRQYDLIVSNPPYFVNALKAPNDARNTARHTDTLSHTDLLKGVASILAPKGIFAVIMPFTEGLIMVAEAASFGLFCNKKTYVKSETNATVKRILLEFAFVPTAVFEDTLIIHQNLNRNYTDKYVSLTHDFYLFL